MDTWALGVENGQPDRLKLPPVDAPENLRRLMGFSFLSALVGVAQPAFELGIAVRYV